ncbi:Cysteine-rich receptor-like protein kinase 29 [Camellia lanceoleosa]|uniref:Cysteine-rich receptor-like protein kinase 29 n=1 Tax=Camellia lanceoleosa TaxID=1840588 RepID=A0ACC0GJB6_9ERIC|nr:Cysteine-rich receptor-like protein kinase 29 [Camellia lanceoleosa]
MGSGSQLLFLSLILTNLVADSPPPSSPPAEPAQPHVRPQGKNQRKDHNTTRTVIIIVVSVISFVIVLIVCICIFLRKRKQRKPKKNVEICKDMDEISTVESLQYDFDTISVATNNFSDANKLGQGGFGVVYWVIKYSIMNMMDPLHV